MSKFSKLFVGMDVHKDSIDVATGDDSASEVRHYLPNRSAGSYLTVRG